MFLILVSLGTAVLRSSFKDHFTLFVLLSCTFCAVMC